MTDLEELTAGELLTLAINEARKYPPDKLYMHDWITFEGGKVCKVCLAGALLVARKPDISLTELNAMIHDNNFDAYFEINSLRIGLVDARFLNTPTKRDSLKSMEYTGLTLDVRQASANPWCNNWEAHSAFARALIASGI